MAGACVLSKTVVATYLDRWEVKGVNDGAGWARGGQEWTTKGLWPRGTHTESLAKAECKDWDQKWEGTSKGENVTEGEYYYHCLLFPVTPSMVASPGVFNIWCYGSKSLLLGPRATVQGAKPQPAPHLPLVCFFAGKRRLGRDHVFSLLSAHGGEAHSHRDQMSQPQGDGHHGLFRYLSYTCGQPHDLPEVQ